MTTNLRSTRRDADDRECGAALVVVLLASLLLSALGAALTVTANMDATVQSSYRADSELGYAAEAAVGRAVQEVRQSTRWDDLLTGAQVSPFLASSSVVSLPSGGTFDLAAETNRWQAITNAALGGPDTPRWRLFSSGRLADIAGPGAIDSSAYLVVWVADDVSEADGNPTADSNGMLLVRGEAVASSGRTRTLDVTVTRAPAPAGRPGLSVISWREVR